MNTDVQMEGPMPSSSLRNLQSEIPVTDIAPNLSVQLPTPNIDAQDEQNEMQLQHDEIQGQHKGDDTVMDTVVVMDNSQTNRRTSTATGMGFANFDPMALGWARPLTMESTNLQEYVPEKEHYLSHRVGNNRNPDMSGGNDTLQSWFYDVDINFPGPRGGHSPFDVPYSFEYNLAVNSTVPLHPENAHDNYQIPNERFARVEQCWPIRSPTVIRLMSTLWHDIIFNSTGNLFSIHHPTVQVSNGDQFKDGSRWGLDEETKVRFETEFGIVGKSSRHASFPIIHNVLLMAMQPEEAQ